VQLKSLKSTVEAANLVQDYLRRQGKDRFYKPGSRGYYGSDPTEVIHRRDLVVVSTTRAIIVGMVMASSSLGSKERGCPQSQDGSLLVSIVGRKATKARCALKCMVTPCVIASTWMAVWERSLLQCC
jgi:hypothetical protein